MFFGKDPNQQQLFFSAMNWFFGSYFAKPKQPEEQEPAPVDVIIQQPQDIQDTGQKNKETTAEKRSTEHTGIERKEHHLDPQSPETPETPPPPEHKDQQPEKQQEEPQPEDAQPLQQSFLYGCHELNDMSQRCELICKKFGVQFYDPIGFRADFKECAASGEGSFKIAFKVDLATSDNRVWTCCMKLARDHPRTARARTRTQKTETNQENERTTNPWKPINLQLEEVCGQVGALLFFEMRMRMQQLHHGAYDPGYEVLRPNIHRFPVTLNTGQPSTITPSFTGMPTRDVLLEHWIEGRYKKYVNTSGKLEPPVGGDQDPDFQRKSSWAAAFCHWTYVHTRGRLIVADMQGAGAFFTDIAIHTVDGNSGVLDNGFKGIQLCAENHRCNGVCRLLGIHEEDGYERQEAETAQPSATVEYFSERYSSSLHPSIQKNHAAYDYYAAVVPANLYTFVPKFFQYVPFQKLRSGSELHS